MKWLWLVPVALLVTVVVGGWLLLGPPPEVPPVSTVDINDIAVDAAERWPDPPSAAGTAASYTITDLNGELLVATGQPITSALQAAQARALTAPVIVDGVVVGFVYYVDDAAAAWQDRDRAMTTRALGVVTAAVLIALAAWGYLWLRVVRPFRRLERFAADVAGGDLAAPLAMDRGNAFGAFSESFDLMRSELAAARASEAEVRASKERLVAQIGHDIRTPVASISATAELLEATAGDAAVAGRAGTIAAKAIQIDRLLGDLFQANHTELSALQVHPVEIASRDVAVLLERADFDGRLTAQQPPDCLLSVDPLRLQQVFDNVVVNSYKYGDPPITVTWSQHEGFVTAHIADRGIGVPSEELSVIFGPGVRGSNVGDVTGSGLGLYTSAYLMEQMGGAISARTDDDGFVVDVTMRLAGEFGIR